MPNSNLLQAELRRLVRDGGKSPDEAAREAIAWADKGMLADYVFPFVRVEAVRIHRELMRSREDDAFDELILAPHDNKAGPKPAEAVPNKTSAGPDKFGRQAGPKPIAKFAVRISSADFYVGGEKVTWGQATPEQHLARAMYQRAEAAGKITDAERHEFVATLLQKQHVKCLDDIDPSSIDADSLRYISEIEAA